MTTVIDLTQEKKTGKPIEFVHYISSNGTPIKTDRKPGEFSCVQRIAASDNGNQFDIIEAFDAPDSIRYRLLGHWNGGYVEE